MHHPMTRTIVQSAVAILLLSALAGCAVATPSARVSLLLLATVPVAEGGQCTSQCGQHHERLPCP